VQANATPMMDGERITGFLSVRTQPSRQEIDAAERLYAQMRAEVQAGRLVHRLQRGTVRRADLRGRLGRLLRPGQRAQVLGLGYDYGALTELHVLWTPPGQLGARISGRERQVNSAVLADQLRLLEFPEVGEAHRLTWDTLEGELSG